MKCEFCVGDLHDRGALYVCQFCEAEYEIQYANGSSNRVHPVCSKEPEPEKFNLGLIRKRLLKCANQVVRMPEEALRLLEDTWVELAAEIKPGEYSVMGELKELREKVAEQDDQMDKWMQGRS